MIVRLDRNGDGVTADGRRVALTLPGERVRETPLEILEPAGFRTTPPCRHFGTCGGCALQHAADPWLADWKRETVIRALANQGLAAEVRATLTSPSRSRRRAVFAGRRTRSGVLTGFHARRSDTVVGITECHVVRPALMDARPALDAITGACASRSGSLRLAVTDSAAGLDVAVTGGKPLDAELRVRLAELSEAHDLARLAWDGEPVAVRRPPAVAFGAGRVVPPPGAFLQATAEAEAALVAAVREGVGSARRVADLFAGCGTFALPLAAAAEVHAVDADAAMLAALDAGWRGARAGLRRVTTERRDLFRRPLLAGELAGFDAVVIDPPRAGAEAQARAVAAARVPRVASVSCDPASFARDAAILVAAGYRLDWVQPIDQFRWSGHVEIAARLSLPGR